MKELKSYTGIWSVEKVIYAINDFNLPFPVSLSQMSWFVVSLLLVILLSKLPPLNFIKGAFLKYLGIPLFLTVFMNGKSFDDKKPYSFIKSVLLFLIRPKISIQGKSVKIHKGIVKKENALKPVEKNYIFSELINPVFYREENDCVSVSLLIKYLDEDTKMIQIFQYDLVLTKEDNWVIAAQE